MTDKVKIALGILLFIIGFVLGKGNQKTMVDKTKENSLNSQLQACQQVIEFDRQALEASSDIVSAMTGTLDSIMSGNIDEIDSQATKIGLSSDIISDLKNKVEPISKICFEE